LEGVGGGVVVVVVVVAVVAARGWGLGKRVVWMGWSELLTLLLVEEGDRRVLVIQTRLAARGREVVSVLAGCLGR
jgi:hypothetical protein